MNRITKTDNSIKPRLVIVVATEFLLFFRGCITNLCSSGFDVSTVTASGPEQELIRLEGASTFDVPINREISPLADVLSLWRLWRVLRSIRPEITNSGNPKAGLLGGLAAVLAGVPCRIYTLHGIRFETTTGVKRRILAWTERIACKCSHRVICDSLSLQQRAIKLGLVEETKTCVIPCHGVEVERYVDTIENLDKADELRRELNLSKKSLVIGFVGRFTRDKGIPELIDAYDKLRCEYPTLRLLLVGRFEDGDPVPLNLRMRIERDESILRPGFVSDTSSYYHLMDIAVLPTWREGFGLVNIEAQAAGKPVVTTRVTGAIDSVLEGETGILVPAGDVAALVQAIGSLLGDASRRAKMGRRGQKWVTREFSRGKILAELTYEYHNLMIERLGSGLHESSNCDTTERHQ